MGICKFCGLKAGLFSSVHKQCEQNYKEGKNSILSKTSEAITSQTDFSELNSEIAIIEKTNHISKAETNELFTTAFDKAVESFLEDGIISKDEEEKIIKFKDHFNLDQDILDKNGSLQKIAKSLILRDVFEGNTPKNRMNIEGTLPFLFQKDEVLIWLFQGAEYYELRNRTTYQGGSQGVSVKIMKGVYYRTSSFKGNPVITQQITPIGIGMLALTNKNIYFAATAKTIKIPYNKLISITPYSDGISLQKDGASAKPQIFKNIDSWFAYNLISNINNL